MDTGYILIITSCAFLGVIIGNLMARGVIYLYEKYFS